LPQSLSRQAASTLLTFRRASWPAIRRHPVWIHSRQHRKAALRCRTSSPTPLASQRGGRIRAQSRIEQPLTRGDSRWPGGHATCTRRCDE